MEASLKQHLQQLEEGLLETTLRHSRDDVVGLLTEEVIEFGSSGRVFNREQIIEAMQGESSVQRSLTDFDATLLAPDVALVTYRVIRHSKPAVCSLRSSIWTRSKGRWRMRFHQGTLMGRG